MDSTNNPYLKQLVDGLEVRGFDVIKVRRHSLLHADLLHFQWPDLLISDEGLGHALRGMAKCLGASVICRLRHRPVVWTVHNLRPHSSRRPRLEALFWACFTRLVTAHISLSRAGAAAIGNAFPALRRKPHAVIAHGAYAADYPPWLGTVEAARAERGLDPGVPYLLFFGQIRRYKGVARLLRVFAEIPTAAVRLCVVGEAVENDLVEQLSELASHDARVTLSLSRVGDDDVSAWFFGALGTVLPFAAGLNSGSVFLSLAMNRPVLVPRTPTFDEIAESVGSRWVVRYDGELDTGALTRFVEHSTELAADPEARPDLSSYDWTTMAAETAAFYERLLQGHS
ncbi:hypothetical protein M6D93_16465 [Jatrophihabitans telluris]|uniref:Glycosyl transferase family 1 domain-containing protein n=1 Tax=Jatrophihabitans telluris TaxID=2038343 RepID=A0ABY4QW38_9ACTN|nr:glycosyltransferase [Jatrophihabitans telluris]UQX87881.1 hypothetical protein M6D93_16465 [Jatrophihabitans telluris]